MDEIKYIADQDVDAEMDRKIRGLLISCFPDQPVFTKQRFYHEMPAHRWYIMENDRMIAHVALHEKYINVNEKMLKTGGIAEVAVHPDARGRGYVRLLLQKAHNWQKNNGYSFSMLFGDSRVYSSSGYVTIDNPFLYYKHDKKEWVTEKIDCAMVACLENEKWPQGLVDLAGPMF
jgi:GNAT superfamily N-acetyltransferase